MCLLSIFLFLYSEEGLFLLIFSTDVYQGKEQHFIWRNNKYFSNKFIIVQFSNVSEKMPGRRCLIN